MTPAVKLYPASADTGNHVTALHACAMHGVRAVLGVYMHLFTLVTDNPAWHLHAYNTLSKIIHHMMHVYLLCLALNSLVPRLRQPLHCTGPMRFPTCRKSAG